MAIKIFPHINVHLIESISILVYAINTLIPERIRIAIGIQSINNAKIHDLFIIINS